MSTVRLQDPRTACLDEGEVLLLLEGTLPESERLAIEAHIDVCEPCRRLVGTSARTVETSKGGSFDRTTRVLPRAPARVLGRGAAIGRYLVLSLLGEGGMGTVYAAYDPKLDRKVAIKLLRTARDSARSRALLMREARALGKLSHPNVVQVHDVGEHRGDVFVAMELVVGRSLDAWCRERARPAWRDVLAAYLDAARGLSAAHATGMVHRDIKPSNLLRGDDGRTRVADFGLAAGRGIEGDADSGPHDAAADDVADVAETASSLDAWLDAKGVLLGTPFYMAPEQHGSARATAASDQYSFCLALYEGLYGKAPFALEQRGRPEAVIDALRALKNAGPPPAPPADAAVPAWVYDAIARGLAPDPERRYPSIDALIAALDVERTEQRVRHQEHTAGARQQFVVLSFFGVFSAVVSFLAWRYPTFASIRHLIGYILVLNVVIWTAIAAWHKLLLASQMGRTVTGSTAIIVMAILFNRLIALRLGTPVSLVLMVDMGMISVILAFGALLVDEWRRIGLALAATSTTGVLVALAKPELALPACSWVSIIALTGLSHSAYRQATRR